jgi:hypothetical protein
VIVGTAVLATVAALGYYTYPQFPLVDARQPPAAGGENSAAPASPAAVLLETAPPETAPPETALADPTRAAANQPRAGRQPVEAPAAKAAAVAIARPQTINAGKGGERAPSRQEACTEAAAALGLCATKPGDAGKAKAQELFRPQACTEAVAALGLCAPKTTQRRE